MVLEEATSAEHAYVDTDGDGLTNGQEVNGGELLIEAAGRACYRSWEEGLNPNVTRIRKDQAQYFINLLNSGHGSVLEHVNFSFGNGNHVKFQSHPRNFLRIGRKIF